MKKSYVFVCALFFVALAGVVFAGAANPGQASPGGSANVPGPKGHWHMFGSYLGLSQEQKDRMRELRSRYYADTHDLRYDIMQKKVEMRKLFTDPKVSDATLLAKLKELGALRQTLMDKRAKMRIEWRKILTAEQIQKLDRMPMRRGMGHGQRLGML